MEKEDLLKLGLSDEVAERIMRSMAAELQVAASRLAVAEKRAEELEAGVQVKEDKIQELSQNAASATELAQKLKDLQAENEHKETEFTAALNKLKLDNAVDQALFAAKAKNPKAVKALLDVEALAVEGDEVKGLAEQLAHLREAEDSAFLFAGEAEKQRLFKGLKPAEKRDRLPNELMAGNLAEAVKSHYQGE